MPIADDWDFDYANQVLSHIDGVLSYDTGGGRQAAVGEYIIGNTSGAVAKVIAVTGNTTSGTLTLTNVDGQFQASETFEVLSEIGFDAVTAVNGGFKVGDTLRTKLPAQLTSRLLNTTKTAQVGVLLTAPTSLPSLIIHSWISLVARPMLLIAQLSTAMSTTMPMRSRAL